MSIHVYLAQLAASSAAIERKVARLSVHSPETVALSANTPEQALANVLGATVSAGMQMLEQARSSESSPPHESAEPQRPPIEGECVVVEVYPKP